MAMTATNRLRLYGLSLAVTAACLEIPPPTGGSVDAGPDAGDGSTGARCGERADFVALGTLQDIGAAGDLDIRDATTPTATATSTST